MHAPTALGTDPSISHAIASHTRIHTLRIRWRLLVPDRIGARLAVHQG